MGERVVQVGSALSVFIAVALVVFGAYRVRYGAGTTDEAVVLLFLAVGVVASYRSLAVHAGPRVNGIGNTALFAGAVAAYAGGTHFGIGPAVTVGQALFAIAVAYFLLRGY
ncbi:MAG: hypothetical protein V5A38_04860 [Halolamina sp.]|uniref:hypothetical protein n=1 Tax=Halolamina sp. TaxID=1940283 RepID=UPI002FC29C90